jgi:hypothetical protein
MSLSSKKFLRSANAAMTLVEIVVSLGISTIILCTSTWFILEGTKASYKAMADVENSIQQWGLTTKLQVDGKIANMVTIINSADKTTWDINAGVPIVIGVEDNDPNTNLKRGKVLVLTKSKLVEGVDSKNITDIIFYYYTGNNLDYTGTLKRYPKDPSQTFKVTNPLDGTGKPKSVATLVQENIDTFTGIGAGVVQDNLTSIAAGGPFAQLGSSNNASIAFIRQETVRGTVKSQYLTEVSFNPNIYEKIQSRFPYHDRHDFVGHCRRNRWLGRQPFGVPAQGRDLQATQAALNERRRGRHRYGVRLRHQRCQPQRPRPKQLHPQKFRLAQSLQLYRRCARLLDKQERPALQRGRT